MVVSPTGEVGEEGVGGLWADAPGFSLESYCCLSFWLGSLGNLTLGPKSHAHWFAIRM